MDKRLKIAEKFYLAFLERGDLESELLSNKEWLESITQGQEIYSVMKWVAMHFIYFLYGHSICESLDLQGTEADFCKSINRVIKNSVSFKADETKLDKNAIKGINAWGDVEFCKALFNEAESRLNIEKLRRAYQGRGVIKVWEQWEVALQDAREKLEFLRQICINEGADK